MASGSLFVLCVVTASSWPSPNILPTSVNQDVMIGVLFEATDRAGGTHNFFVQCNNNTSRTTTKSVSDSTTQ